MLLITWSIVLINLPLNHECNVSASQVPTLDTVQDFFIKLGIKQPMHLLKIGIFSRHFHVIVRSTKIMNRVDKNWAHF